MAFRSNTIICVSPLLDLTLVKGIVKLFLILVPLASSTKIIDLVVNLKRDFFYMSAPNAVRSKRGRRGRGGSLSNRLRTSLRHQNRADFAGFVPNGRIDPPRVLLTPWNTMVLSTLITGATSAGNTCLSMTDISGLIRTQTGMPSTVIFSLRLLSAQCWHIVPNGELNNQIRVRFFSLLQPTTNTTCSITYTLAQIEDYGTPARNATAKFIWPKTHSSNVFNSDSNLIPIRFTTSPSQQILLHITLLWRFNGAALTRINFADMSIERDLLSELHNSDSLMVDSCLSSVEHLSLE